MPKTPTKEPLSLIETNSTPPLKSKLNVVAPAEPLPSNRAVIGHFLGQLGSSAPSHCRASFLAILRRH